VQRLQRLTAEAGEWARDYRARQRAAAANQAPAPPQQLPATALRTVAETQMDAPVAALAAYTQSGSCISAVVLLFSRFIQFCVHVTAVALVSSRFL